MLQAPASVGMLGSMPSLVRGICSTSALGATAPAIVGSKAKNESLASLLGFGSTRIDTPLSEPLENVPAPFRKASPSTPTKLQTGNLNASTSLAAIETYGPASTVAMAFETGTGHESAHTQGAGRVMEAMAFKASKNRTTFRLTRELEKIGAKPSAAAGRENTAFAISGLRMHLPEAVEILLDTVLNARINYHEFAEAASVVKAGMLAAHKDPKNVITDILHRAAYDGPLGQPQFPDPSELSNLDYLEFKNYYHEVLKPSKAVLAAAGADFEEIKQLAGPLVPQSSAPTAQGSPSTYLGGFLNVITPSPLTHVALALECKGGLSDSKASATAAVIDALLAGRSRAVLPHSHGDTQDFQLADSFSHMYAQTGLVGLSAAAAPAQASQLVDTLIEKVSALGKGVPEQHLQLAKQAAIGSYKQQMGSTAGFVQAMAPRLLLSGAFQPADFVAGVQGVTGSDVANFITSGLKHSPTIVTYGNMSSVPRLNIALRRLLA